MYIYNIYTHKILILKQQQQKHVIYVDFDGFKCYKMIFVNFAEALQNPLVLSGIETERVLQGLSIPPLGLF